MKRRLLAIPVAAAVALAGVGTAAQAASPTLSGTVGPGFTITLKKAGKKVTRVSAGTYKIKINDRSNIHNFHLTGPGLNKKTSVPSTGSTTWTVHLRRGTYKYVCDPHASMMKGSFTVR